MKSIIKSLLKRAGFMIHRLQPWHDNYKWILERNIKTVVDIGANTGQFVQFIRTIMPDVRVYAFEPVPEVFQVLKRNTSDSNVFLYPFALGSENKKSDININTFNPSSSLLELADRHITNYEFARESHKERIDVRRADDVLNEFLLEKNVLVKIDVQGYEEQVLKGAMKLLAKAEIVICEVCYEELYKNQPLFHNLYMALSNMGFRYAGSIEQYYNNETGIPLYADGIFLR